MKKLLSEESDVYTMSISAIACTYVPCKNSRTVVKVGKTLSTA